MNERKEVDISAYSERCRSGPCFICEIVRGNPEYRHHVVYEDAEHIVFLNKYPTLYGYTLVSPKEHRVQVTGDFAPGAYLHLQRLIYHVAEAVRKTGPTERIYLLSLGSQQGNQHVHWHVAPLPPGVPYDEQQLAALDFRRGILDLTAAEMESLAGRLRAALQEELQE